MWLRMVFKRLGIFLLAEYLMSDLYRVRSRVDIGGGSTHFPILIYVIGQFDTNESLQTLIGQTTTLHNFSHLETS